MSLFNSSTPDEVVAKVGPTLLTQTDALQRTLDQSLSRVVTVRDMLSGGKFDLPIDWSGIDALRDRARRMQANHPRATFEYQSQQYAFRDALEQYEAVAADADKWRGKR
jgi:hypothetical protein